MATGATTLDELEIMCSLTESSGSWPGGERLGEFAGKSSSSRLAARTLFDREVLLDKHETLSVRQRAQARRYLLARAQSVGLIEQAGDQIREFCSNDLQRQRAARPAIQALLKLQRVNDALQLLPTSTPERVRPIVEEISASWCRRTHRYLMSPPAAAAWRDSSTTTELVALCLHWADSHPKLLRSLRRRRPLSELRHLAEEISGNPVRHRGAVWFGNPMHWTYAANGTDAFVLSSGDIFVDSYLLHQERETERKRIYDGNLADSVLLHEFIHTTQPRAGNSHFQFGTQVLEGATQGLTMTALGVDRSRWRHYRYGVEVQLLEAFAEQGGWPTLDVLRGISAKGGLAGLPVARIATGNDLLQESDLQLIAEAIDRIGQQARKRRWSAAKLRTRFAELFAQASTAGWVEQQRAGRMN